MDLEEARKHNIINRSFSRFSIDLLEARQESGQQLPLLILVHAMYHLCEVHQSVSCRPVWKFDGARHRIEVLSERRDVEG